MAAITTRSTSGAGATVKNAALLNQEVDNNFININSEIYVDNYPTVEPSLYLDFLNAGALDSRLTFTRSSTATCFNPNGVLTRVLNNTPRFTYDPVTRAPQGFLIEEQRTNLFLNQGGLGGGTLGTGTVLGPDSVMCSTFIPNSGSANFPSFGNNTQSFSIANGATIDYAFSGWFAQGPIGSITLEPMVVLDFNASGSSRVYATLQINTSNGTVRTKGLDATQTEVSAPTITQVRPGLYYVTWVVRYTQNATARNTVQCLIQVRNTAGSGTYTTDGVSGVQYSSCQIEQGSSVTSYIPTTTSQATRQTDQVGLTTLVPWFNPLEGTLYAEATTTNTASFNTIASLSDVSTNNSIRHIQWNDGTDRTGFITAGGANQASLNGSGQIGTAKYAIAYKLNNVNSSKNGVLGTPDTSVTIPTVTGLWVGQTGPSLFPLNGWIRKIVYYPQRLVDVQHQALTVL